MKNFILALALSLGLFTGTQVAAPKAEAQTVTWQCAYQQYCYYDYWGRYVCYQRQQCCAQFWNNYTGAYYWRCEWR